MTRQLAVLMVVLGAVFLSTGAVFMRLIESAGGFQILFYRSFTLCGTILAFVCIRRRHTPLQVFKSLDRIDLGIGLLISISFTGYVFAVLNTTVPSALFILTASPLVAATVGWLWIGEKPHPVTWLSMAIACGGVLFMVGDGLAAGRTFGNLCALVAASSFAVMLVFARRSRKTDILGGSFLAGLLSGLYGLVVMLTFGNGLEVDKRDLALILTTGVFSIGIGLACITWATPYIPAAEVGVIVLIESVLAPFWVWLFGFEGITEAEIVGGVAVLTSVILLSVFSGRSIPPPGGGQAGAG